MEWLVHSWCAVVEVVVLMWNRVQLRRLLLATLLIIAGCGQTEEKTNSLPTATDPTPATQTSITPPTPTADPRLPQWIERAAAVQLRESRNYLDLEALFGVVYPPLVGNPRVAMDLFGERNQDVVGKVYLGFEDKMGFVYAEIPSVDDTGYRNSTFFSAIFSDDMATVRVTGPVENNVLKANFYYRIRGNNDPACKRWTRCDYAFGPYSCYRWVDSEACNTYMQESHSEVKMLGSFEAAQYADWIVVK